MMRTLFEMITLFVLLSGGPYLCIVD